MTDITIFSSPIGLGHITRDIAIADKLSEPVNFVTGSGAVKILQRLDKPVQDVYNPPSFAVKDGLLGNSARWLWNYYRYYKDCKNIAKKILQDSKPRLVISDEDFASLSVAQEMNIPTILITDILETRFTKGISSFVEKKMNQSMKNIMEKCNAIIMPEDGKDTDNIKRVGPIVRDTKSSREQLRERFQFHGKTILITVGGTDAGLFLIQRAIDAISSLNDDYNIVLVAGPTISKKFNVRNLGFVENLHEYIYAADLVISLAGKSTIDEANAYGTPGIFIPIKGHFEQEDNAKMQGYFFEDVYRLAKLIPTKIHRKQHNTDGAARAASIIEKFK